MPWKNSAFAVREPDASVFWNLLPRSVEKNSNGSKLSRLPPGANSAKSKFPMPMVLAFRDNRRCCFRILFLVRPNSLLNDPTLFSG